MVNVTSTVRLRSIYQCTVIQQSQLTTKVTAPVDDTVATAGVGQGGPGYSFIGSISRSDGCNKRGVCGVNSDSESCFVQVNIGNTDRCTCELENCMCFRVTQIQAGDLGENNCISVSQRQGPSCHMYLDSILYESVCSGTQDR